MIFKRFKWNIRISFKHFGCWIILYMQLCAEVRPCATLPLIRVTNYTSTFFSPSLATPLHGLNWAHSQLTIVFLFWVIDTGCYNRHSQNLSDNGNKYFSHKQISMWNLQGSPFSDPGSLRPFICGVSISSHVFQGGHSRGREGCRKNTSCKWFGQEVIFAISAHSPLPQTKCKRR